MSCTPDLIINTLELFVCLNPPINLFSIMFGDAVEHHHSFDMTTNRHELTYSHKLHIYRLMILNHFRTMLVSLQKPYLLIVYTHPSTLQYTLQQSVEQSLELTGLDKLVTAQQLSNIATTLLALPHVTVPFTQGQHKSNTSHAEDSHW